MAKRQRVWRPVQPVANSGPIEVEDDGFGGMYYSVVDVSERYLKVQLFDRKGFPLVETGEHEDVESALRELPALCLEEHVDITGVELREIGGGDTGWDDGGLMV